MKRTLIIILLFVSLVPPVYAELGFANSYSPKQVYNKGVLLSTVIFDKTGLLYKEINHGWGKSIGINRIYYKTGRKKAEYCFEKGRFLHYEKYDEEGNLMFASINETWGTRRDREFYKNGKIKKEIVYKYSELVSTKEYSEKGELITSSK